MKTHAALTHDEQGKGMAFPPLPGYAVEHRGLFRHVMALALNPLTGFEDGIIRCITSREGSVDVAGFIDHSELRLVGRQERYQYAIGERLCIHNEEETIASLHPGDGFDFLGLEDPDLALDDAGVLHLYFTLPFVNRRDGENLIYLGHAEGPSLAQLSMTAPVLAKDSATAKEVAMVPKGKDGRYRHLVESSAPGSEHSAYSTVRVAEASGFGPHWNFGPHVIHPADARIPWLGGHASPGPFLPRSFIDAGEGKLVGFLNGRAHDRAIGEQVVFGTFSVGLYVYDYEQGTVEWISPVPCVEDQDAKTITFASQFIETTPGEGILYAHVDDSFVRAYRVTREAVKALFPQPEAAQREP